MRFNCVHLRSSVAILFEIKIIAEIRSNSLTDDLHRVYREGIPWERPAMWPDAVQHNQCGQREFDNVAAVAAGPS
jgi:hypothetical protein